MWFSGPISQAIASSKAEKSLLVVFVKKDNDEDSDRMETLWEDADILKLCTDNNVIALKLIHESESSKQFAQIYPLVCVPITFMIGQGGVPLEIVAGAVTKEALTNQFSSAIEAHRRKINLQSPSLETRADQKEAASEEHRVEESEHAPESGQDLLKDLSEEEGEGKVGRSGEISEEKAPEVEPKVSVEEKAEETVEEKLEESGSTGGEGELNLEEKITRARELLEVRQIQKSKMEAEKEKEEEMKRRQEGKAMLKVQQGKEEIDMKKMVEERKKRKQEDKEALRRIKEQIAQDRADKKAGYEKDQGEKRAELEEKRRQKEEEEMERLRQVEIERSSFARIQFRLPDGCSVLQQFSADGLFQEAVDFITEETVAKFGSFHLLQMYPRREFPDGDLGRSFRELELVPTAVLLVMPSSGRLVSSGWVGGLLNRMWSWICTPVVFTYQLFLSFFGLNQPRGAVEDSKKKNQKNEEGFGSNQSGIRRMPKASGNDDDDNATWNGNSTQQL